MSRHCRVAIAYFQRIFRAGRQRLPNFSLSRSLDELKLVKQKLPDLNMNQFGLVPKMLIFLAYASAVRAR